MTSLPRALTVAALLIGLAASGPAAADSGKGWLYVHRYLSDAQLTHYKGIAVAPFWFFDENGAMVPSEHPDNHHAPGKRVEVPAGWYYVVAGQRNVGATRVRYKVVPGRTTAVKTGFVQISTWREEEIPRVDCALWDAELTAFVRKPGTPPEANAWLPILSNPAVEFGTREFGMLQLPVGQYRILWHAFTKDVEVKEGQVLRMPLGTAGPLGPDRPKGRLSTSQGEGANNRTLNLCKDGPTHVIAGTYWLSYAKLLDVYPYEERVWAQSEIEAVNRHGYHRESKPDPIPGAWYNGEGSQPAPAADASVTVPTAASGAPKDAKVAGDGLGGTGIDWDAPP